MVREDATALAEAALKAMRRAVQRVRREHRKTGDPLYVLRNGRVTKIVLRPRRRKSR
jgi:hypothetical protein